MKPTGFVLGLAIMLFAIGSTAQENYELSPGYKKNVLKWNMTPFLLWSSKNINISYERVLKHNRSFSVNAGYFVLPIGELRDNVNLNNNKSKGGFSVSGDYRFYFQHRNTKPAPDGLYWGPFASAHYYQFENDISFNDNQSVQGSAHFGADMSIYSLGIQLGYQFVIKDRLTVDLIFIGPALSVYSLNVNLSGDLSFDEESEALKALQDILEKKLPILDKLLEDKTIKHKGTTTSLGAGLRYMLQLGYRF